MRVGSGLHARLLNGRRSRVRSIALHVRRPVGARGGEIIRAAGRNPARPFHDVYHELIYGAAYSERRAANENKIALFLAAGSLELIPSNGLMRGRRRISVPI